MLVPKIVLVAESVVRDSETNQISVFNILEELGSEIFPVLIPKVSLITFYHREEADPVAYEGSLVVSLGEGELQRYPVTLDFEGKLRTRLHIVINGLVIPNPGPLTFHTIFGDVQTDVWAIEVKQAGIPKAVVKADS